jgi:hypothetical protein
MMDDVLTSYIHDDRQCSDAVEEPAFLLVQVIPLIMIH